MKVEGEGEAQGRGLMDGDSSKEITFMDDQASVKRISDSDHLQELVDSDFALAFALQEQETGFAVFPAIPSTASEESDEDDYDDDGDYPSFSSLEFDEELGVLEEEDSNNDSVQDEMEEDDIDPDELSYEDLIALGEIVGEESRGLSAEEIPSCLSPYTYEHNPPSTVDGKDNHLNIIDNDRCVICQIEYDKKEEDDEQEDHGETLVVLPCNHPFHSQCITKWLLIKKICPICNAEVSPSNITLQKELCHCSSSVQ